MLELNWILVEVYQRVFPSNGVACTGSSVMTDCMMSAMICSSVHPGIDFQDV